MEKIEGALIIDNGTLIFIPNKSLGESLILKYGASQSLDTIGGEESIKTAAMSLPLPPVKQGVACAKRSLKIRPFR